MPVWRGGARPCSLAWRRFVMIHRVSGHAFRACLVICQGVREWCGFSGVSSGGVPKSSWARGWQGLAFGRQLYGRGFGPCNRKRVVEGARFGVHPPVSSSCGVRGVTERCPPPPKTSQYSRGYRSLLPSLRALITSALGVWHVPGLSLRRESTQGRQLDRVLFPEFRSVSLRSVRARVVSVTSERAALGTPRPPL